MNKFSFNRWRLMKEFADYGHEKSIDQKVHKELGGTSAFKGDNPIDPINSHLIIKELKRLPPLGVFNAQDKWTDVLEWGYNAGALQIDITPLGSYKIMVRKKIKDLQGETHWICKKVLPLNENDHNKNEIPLAHEIYDNLQEINKEMVEGPLKEFPEFDRLALDLFGEVKRKYPAYIMFPFGMKKISENYYKIIFEFRGHGVEAPADARALQFNIDFLWDNKKGLLRCWGYDIDTAKKSYSWYPAVSEWDEYFSPAQEPKEIIEAVVQCFLTY